ncbi:MAG TPA: SPOR domain-containing protein [Mucilaginibacter sp.]|nr:SPOR domain-containing protein [Mucilaginibacter sp.]
MNLADYLSELLGQYEEVSVPGLGYFVRERINGYYNDKEARFYPPHHKVKFVPRPKDDDLFTQYVADKKNISLASSKYFAEKFVSKLREQALTGKYLFADLGLFYTENDQLVFKPNDVIPDDPAFYGYPALSVYKQGAPLNEQYSRPSFSAPSAKPVTPAQLNQPVIDEPYFEEEAERRRGINVWLIVLIAITVLALGVFGVYKFYPTAFDKISDAYHRITGKKDTEVPVYRREAKPDSSARSAQPRTNDTTLKATTPAAVQPPDTIRTFRYEIIVSSFKSLGYANNEVKRLKAKGLDAKIVTDAPGPRLKISVGSFPTYEAAQAEIASLKKQGKITGNVNPEKINN